jgi:hypothetical protein
MLAADLGPTLDGNDPAVVNEDMINDAVRPQNGCVRGRGGNGRCGSTGLGASEDIAAARKAIKATKALAQSVTGEKRRAKRCAKRPGIGIFLGGRVRP